MFMKQLNDYSCSPVCLYNVGVWAYGAYPYKYLYEKCMTDEEGTYDEDFEKILRNQWNNVKVTRKRDWGFDDINSFLRKPSTAVVLAHRETWLSGGDDMHHSLWLGPNFAVNLKKGHIYSKDENVEDIALHTLTDTDDTPIVYFLEKR